MSNRPKPRPAHRHPGPGPGEGYAAVPAIVPDRFEAGAVEFARKVTHDALIEAWGPARRSGVWWTQRPGASGARLYSDLAAVDGKEIEPEAAEMLKTNPRALVVVAWAIVAEGTPSGRMRSGWIKGQS